MAIWSKHANRIHDNRELFFLLVRIFKSVTFYRKKVRLSTKSNHMQKT